MSSNPKKTEAAILETYRVALDNAEQQPQIATLMAELGYNSEKIAEGKTIFAQTRAAFDFTRTEADETTAAYAQFSAQRDALITTFKSHRRKAKVAFRTDAVAASQLAITGEMPRTYIATIEAAKKFYAVATTDTAIQTKLSTLAITAEQLTATNAQIAQVEAARTTYLREVGESEEATQAKDAAFSALDNWMSEFYAVARIALEEHPQLLEALGKKA